MIVHEGWVAGDAGRLQYLAYRSAKGQAIEVAYIPGLLSGAEEFTPVLERLGRPALSMSLRGRGGSDARGDDFGFEDHLADVQAVLAMVVQQPVTIIAFSAGVPLAVRYAAMHPDRVAGLILIDHAPVWRARNDRWARTAQEQRPDVPQDLIRLLCLHAQRVSLWDDLPAISCPVLVVRAETPTSQLTNHDVERLQRDVRRFRLCGIEGAGHVVWRDNLDHFVFVLREFIDEVAASVTGEM